MGFAFDVDGVEVLFPYDAVYPEQYAYMRELKKALDAKGHGVLEMPTGTGKTVTVFSFVTAYQFAHPEIGKLIFCTRTVPEMNKALVELRTVMEYRIATLAKRRKEKGEPEKISEDGFREGEILAVGLSARRNLCVHPEISAMAERESVDEKCRELTAPWVRDDTKKNNKCGCSFYDEYEKRINTPGSLLKPGVYSLDDLRDMGATTEKWCPYFMARKLLAQANVCVLNYQYILDPKVSASALMGGTAASSSIPLQAEIAKEPHILVFDEAHNIDNVCLEAFTVQMNRKTLDRAKSNLTSLSNKIVEMKANDSDRLQKEYEDLLNGLKQSGQIDDDTANRLASPILPDDVLEEVIPGSIRKAENFLSFMHRLVSFLKTYVRVDKATTSGTLSLLHQMEENADVDSRSLKFSYERMRSLLNTLQVSGQDEFGPISRVADFVTLLSTYAKGFIVINDPYPEAEGIYDPVTELACLDSSLAMKPALKRFQSIILTSGTISPLDMYPRLLGMDNVVVTKSFSIQLDRKSICPLIVTRGSDQVPISSRFQLRNDPSVIRNYGQLLLDLVKVVPDGMVCFFTSYMYMEMVVKKWYESGILARIMEHKLVFIETKDVVTTTYALSNFRLACDSGRGAVFLSIARGKVSEGIDFDRHYGRAVVMFGVPFQYTLSRNLRARLEFLKDNHNVKESEFLNFDAMRQASQCVGRIIRSKSDYGIMIFADQRFMKIDKRDKIPDWINTFMEPSHINLSVDMASNISRNFLLEMSQPVKGVMSTNSIIPAAQFAEVVAKQAAQAKMKAASGRTADVVMEEDSASAARPSASGKLRIKLASSGSSGQISQDPVFANQAVPAPANAPKAAPGLIRLRIAGAPGAKRKRPEDATPSPNASS